MTLYTHAFMARKMPKREIKIKKRHAFYGKKNAQNRNQNQEKTPDIVHMYCILIGKGNMGFHIGLSVVPSIHTIDLTFWLGNW